MPTERQIAWINRRLARKRSGHYECTGKTRDDGNAREQDIDTVFNGGTWTSRWRYDEQRLADR